MKIGDKVYIKTDDHNGYWWGEISSIKDEVATVNGFQTVWRVILGYNEAFYMGSIKKVIEENLFYKQWAYWEK